MTAPGPDQDIVDALFARVDGLANTMRKRKKVIVVVNDRTKNGTPCTVIMAVGDWAEAVHHAGEMIADEIKSEDQAASDAASKC